MARITKIVRMENRGTYGLVYVEVGAEEAVVIVGGECQVYHSDKYDLTMAYVKRGDNLTKSTIDNTSKVE